MNELIKSMQVVHANTFLMYFKAHAFHWNVEGRNFPTYHDFFGDLYTELHVAIDPIAEEIRSLDSYAPSNLTDVYSNATVKESSVVGNDIPQMLMSLMDDNSEVINSLNAAFKLANDADEQGLVDFIAGRIDIHKKHAWMLKASLKGQ
jgi:starvation-inducible DNA-binding protein